MPVKPRAFQVTIKEIVLIPPLLVACILAGLAAEHSIWLLALPSSAIVVLILALLDPKPAPTPLTSLAIAPDHIGVAGERVPLKDVRRIEQLAAPGGHEVIVHTEHGPRTVARTREKSHARYISDRLDETYRAFLRRRTRS